MDDDSNGDATAYTLRHSTITDLVTAGLPLLAIAQLSRTSVAMIENHYGHLASKAACRRGDLFEKRLRLKAFGKANLVCIGLERTRAVASARSSARYIP